MNYKSIISIIALIALLVPVFSMLVEIPIALAQNYTVTIKNIYVVDVDGKLKSISDVGGIWPGESIIVETSVGFVTPYDIVVYDYHNESLEFVRQTIRPSEAGTYNISLYIPYLLLNNTGWVGFRVEPTYGSIYYYPGYYYIYPKITVTPSTTALVDSYGTPITETFTVYGVADGVSVSTIDIINATGTKVCTISVNKPASPTNSTVVFSGNLVNTTDPNQSLCKKKSLPSGDYTVNFTLTSATGLYNVNEAKPKTATLTIKPMVFFTTREGNGMYVYKPSGDGLAKNDTIILHGVGFKAGSFVTRIRLNNTNFTNVYYDFPYPLNNTVFYNRTDADGYFNVTDLLSIKPTNMTAGLYIPTVYTREHGELSGQESIPIGEVGWVAVDLSNMYIPGVTGVVNATSQINVTKGYVKVADTSGPKDKILEIPFTDGRYNYVITGYLSATHTVTFALYNTSATPVVEVFNKTVTASYDSQTGAYIASIGFNITGKTSVDNPGGFFIYNVTYYEYATYAYLLLEKYSYQLTGGLVSIVYTIDTQVVNSVKYTTADLTVKDNVVYAPTWKFNYSGFAYTINWRYDMDAQKAYLNVVVDSLEEVPYTFTNSYYLVRPILVFLYGGKVYKTYPEAVMPNTTITMIAFGYSPGYGWYDFHNYLTVTLDMVSPLTVVELGRDGNVTFPVTIPVGTTFGSHYIHGIDSRGYEYSVAIVIGAKAVFVVRLKPDKIVVSASYYNTHVEACPCAVYEGKTFCDVCVVYTGTCDYLGDYVDVTLYGLQPGEKLVKLYLDTIEVPSSLITPTTPVADSNGMMTFKFLVPSIPEGNYTIRVVTSVSGETTVVWAKNTSISYIVVKPKLLLVTLDSNVTGGTGVLPILVGPGVVRVIGTGFTPGVSFDTILVNMTDAFRPIYTNIRYWSVDSNGILIGGKVEDKDIYPAILFQVLQPGKYEVRLTYYYGPTLKLSEPGYIYVVNNLTYVSTKEDIEKLGSNIDAGFSNLATLITTGFSGVENYLNVIYGLVSGLDNKADAILRKLDTVLDNVTLQLNAISASISDLKNSVSTGFTTISGKLDTVLNNITLQLNSISTGISDLKSSVSTGFSSLNGTISTGFTAISGKLDAVNETVGYVMGNVTSIITQLNTVYGLILSQGGKVDTILSLVNDIHTNMTYAMIKLDKIDAIASKLSDISTSLSTISSSINALSGKLDDVKSAVNSVSSSISDLSSKVAGLDTKITGLDSKMDSGFKGLEAKITSLDSKVDTRFNEVSSKVDSAGGAASNSMYIGVVATFFALLAMVFALLGYSTIRKSVVPK